MICEYCGRPLGKNDKVADIEIDLSRSERYNFLACKSCSKKIVKEFEGEGVE